MNFEGLKTDNRNRNLFIKDIKKDSPFQKLSVRKMDPMTEVGNPFEQAWEISVDGKPTFEIWEGDQFDDEGTCIGYGFNICRANLLVYKDGSHFVNEVRCLNCKHTHYIERPAVQVGKTYTDALHCSKCGTDQDHLFKWEMDEPWERNFESFTDALSYLIKNLNRMVWNVGGGK